MDLRMLDFFLSFVLSFYFHWASLVLGTGQELFGRFEHLVDLGADALDDVVGGQLVADAGEVGAEAHRFEHQRADRLQWQWFHGELLLQNVCLFFLAIEFFLLRLLIFRYGLTFLIDSFHLKEK